MTEIMSKTKRYILVLLKVTIIVLVCFCNEVQGKEYAPFGLRKIDYFRRKFGPVKMLSHSTKSENKDTNVNELPLKTEDEINQSRHSSIEPKENNDDNNGIVHKELDPTMSETEDPVVRKEQGYPPVRPKKVVEAHSNKNCWMDANAKEHFEIMDRLDNRYEKVRVKYQEAAEKDNFSKDMLDMMIKTRGVAHREIHKAKGDQNFIPAGINLGGYGMLRLDDSILFFHRMKLRNNTHFEVKRLENDLANMALTVKMSLNDLHILGAYERATTLNDPVQLFYTPTFGEAEFLLKNVEYNMEGRYRMLRDKLAIELVISDIVVNDILLTYQNACKSVVLERKNIDEFLDRLKVDLDKWLKDYFNDYLMYFGLVGENANEKFIEYNREKTIKLNEYTDQMLEKIGRRIKELKLCAVRLPLFSVTAVNGMQIKLTHGVLRGLESLHRRSLATGKREDEVRKVDAIVGFSSLKATYQYEAVFNTGVPPINGLLVVTADEMVAHFSLTLTEDPKSGDLRFDSIQQLKPESLTLEGPANRIIGNFKSLLERHVFTFISNAIIHNVNMLRTLTKCEPLLFSIHHTCDEEEEDDIKTKSNNSDNNGDSFETAKSVKDSNNDNDKQNIDEDNHQKMHQDQTSPINGGEENNEENVGSNRAVVVEIETNADKENANDDSEKNRNLDTNNGNIENANDDTETNRGLDTNNDKYSKENANENTQTNRGLDTNNDQENAENNNDNTETNRDLDILNDRGIEEIANDSTKTYRDLDITNDEEINDNGKSALNNAEDITVIVEPNDDN